jgi:hypothetical protein
MNQPTPTLRILGIRGVPAAHGGFETFAERLALDLASMRETDHCALTSGKAWSAFTSP